MKRWKAMMAIGALALTCGCFQVEDELTLAPDGSGTVKITVRSSLPEEMFQMMGMGAGMGGGASPLYPPINQAEARHFFPAKDFSFKFDEKTEGETRITVTEASFTDVNALLASPYARAHQLALKIDGGKLKLLAQSGGSAVAAAAEMRSGRGMDFGQFPGMDEAAKKKDEMRFAFAVTLPAAAEGNGAGEGNRVAWAVERAKCKDDAEFAAKLSGLLEASCPAGDVKFSPVTPPRLGLLPFAQLAEGKAPPPTPVPDTNKIAAAVKFIPCSLQVTRALDLSGEGGGQSSQAQLTGVVLLPKEFEPHRWGETKVQEAVDAAGNNLAAKQDGDDEMAMFRNLSRRYGIMEDPEDQESGKETEPKPHWISLGFKAPEWKVKRIAKIRGTVELQYLGGSEVLKFSNAVPAAMVMDLTKRSSFSQRYEPNRGQLSHPRLADLGLSLQVQNAMVQGAMTTLSLQTRAGQGSLLAAQVFDAQGRPWPTTLMQNSSGGEQQWCQIMVAGKPAPPLSLAVEAGGLGATVAVPISLEDVATEGK